MGHQARELTPTIEERSVETQTTAVKTTAIGPLVFLSVGTRTMAIVLVGETPTNRRTVCGDTDHGDIEVKFE